MSRQELDDRDEKRENAGELSSRLGEIVRSLRPLYYAGVGIGIGYAAGSLFGENIENGLILGFGYNVIDGIARKPENKKNLKEIIIVYVGCMVGQTLTMF